MNKLACGIGINDRKYSAKINHKHTKEYTLWINMLKRFDGKYSARNTTYKELKISENFKHYSFFYEWCQEQIGFNSIDKNGKLYELDKDLLVKGNKLYSEDTCVFIPHRINSLLIKCNSARGDSPIGVYWCTSESKYHSLCSDGKGNQKYLGSFISEEKAFQAYKSYKEALIKEVAEEYKDCVDKRAYQALMSYKVSIDD